MSQTAVPQEVIDAMDRLNGHARGRSLGFPNGEKDALYAYKAAVVVELARAAEVTARLVRVVTTCRSCEGTGTWIDYEASFRTPVATLLAKEPCRTCRRAGQVTLYFLETTLPGGRVWHHPWSTRTDNVGYSIACEVWPGLKRLESGDGYKATDGAELMWESPGDWRPNLPPCTLSASALVELLNVVEPWIAAMWTRASWRLERAQRELVSYHLHLGRAAGDCCICGSPYVTHTLGRHSDRLQWSLPVCSEHQNLSPSKWPQDLPPSLMTEDVQAWLDNPLRRQRRAA